MKKLSKLYIFLISMLTAKVALAGHYAIEEKGTDSFGIQVVAGISHKPLCEAYLKHVVEYNQPIRPLVCQRPFDPAAKAFSEPVWTPVTGAALDKYIAAIARYRVTKGPGSSRYKNNPKDREPMYMHYIENGHKGLEAGRVRYDISEFDLNNDKSSDIVLRSSNLTCDENNISHYSLGGTHNYYLIKNAA